ncbi:MAG: helix-turn-helix transcriptional regulator [Nitrospirae bacterium]|nr:helix-turn-helix transcriptional regulator [Nitrospirota bacterium]
MTLGKTLKELRRQRGLTLRDLSKLVDLNFTYLSKIENGKIEYTPSAEKIRAIAEALNADELALLKLANKVPPELKSIADNVKARDFFRRAKDVALPEDWEDLLDYLDEKHRARQKTKKREGNK